MPKFNSSSSLSVPNLTWLIIAAFWLTPDNFANAQNTAHIEGTFGFEVKPHPNPTQNDPNRCGGILYFQFADVEDATAYWVVARDGISKATDNWGYRYSNTGPAGFNDSYQNVDLHVAPGGTHRWVLTSYSTGQGCGAATTAMTDQLSGRFGGLGWKVGILGPFEPPVANFSWTESDDELAIDFDGASSTDSDGQVVEYQWEFGDGETGEGAQVSHAYDSVGDYTVVLTVKDNEGYLSEPFSDPVSVSAVRWKYAVSLEVASTSTGKGITPGGVESEVGDTVLVQIQVENFGTHRLENIRVANGPSGIQVLSDKIGALVYTESTYLGHIDVLEPGSSDQMIFAHEAAHVAQQTDYTVFVAEVTAEAVDPDSGEREAVQQTVTSCPISNKGAGVSSGGGGQNVACAMGATKPDMVTLTLQTDADSGNSLSVKSGLYYKTGTKIQVQEKIDPNGSGRKNWICRSSCVDVEVEVIGGINGGPKEDVDVRFGAPVLTSDAIKTPGGTTGFFCERTNSIFENCGNLISVKTDSDGKARAYYSLPGVTEAVPVTITALAFPDGKTITRKADLTILPNIIADDTQTISRASAVALNSTNLVILTAFGITIAGEVCKGFVNGVLQPVVTLGGRMKDANLNSATGTAVEFICALSPSKPIDDVAGIVKRVAEVSQWFWFFGTFNVDLPGFVNIVPRPPLQFFDVDNDFLSVLSNAFQGGASKGVIRDGSRFDIKLYEMSYLDQNALVDRGTPAIYFTMDIVEPGGKKYSFTNLMEGGTYVPWTFLLPSFNHFSDDIIDRLVAESKAGDSIIYTDGSDTGGKHGGSSSGAFAIGDYIVIGIDTEQEELNQVIGTGTDLLSLAVPLKHDHDEETTVIHLGSGSAVLPSAPFLVPLVRSIGPSPAGTILEWVANPTTFVSTYDIQVSRDSLFTVLVTDSTAHASNAFTTGPLVDEAGYYWRVRGSNLAGAGEWSNSSYVPIVTGVDSENQAEIPTTLVLEANYPNPFNPRTTIGYSLPVPAAVRLVVYDALGRQVRVLVDGHRVAGTHRVVFNADNISSGIYFYHMEVGNEVRAGRMVLLK